MGWLSERVSCQMHCVCSTHYHQEEQLQHGLDLYLQLVHLKSAFYGQDRSHLYRLSAKFRRCIGTGIQNGHFPRSSFGNQLGLLCWDTPGNALRIRPR